MKCTGVTRDTGESVSMTFADGSSVTSDFAVGADGILPATRHHLAPDTEEPHFSGLLGVVGIVMASDLDNIQHPFKLPAMLSGGTNSFAIMPASYSGGKVGYFATIEAHRRSPAERDTFGHGKADHYQLLEKGFLYQGGKWPEFVKALCWRTPVEV